MQKRLFITSTFFGTIVRDFVYLYIGFTGAGAATEIIDGIEGASSIVTIVLALIGMGILGFILYKKYAQPKA